MDLKLPPEVKAMFDHVVKTKFHGDEEEAVIQAVVFFLEREKEHLMTDEKFRVSLQNALELYSKRSERADSEFSDAFERIRKRRSKAAEFFNQLTQGDKD